MYNDFFELKDEIGKLVQLGQVYEAIALLDKEQFFNTHTGFWSLYEDCYLALNIKSRAKFYRIKEIQNEIELWLNQPDQSAPMLTYLGTLFYEMGCINKNIFDIQQSCNYFDQAITQDVSQSCYYVTWGAALFKIGMISKSVEPLIESCRICSLAIEFDNQLIGGYSNLGHALGLIGTYTKDISKLEEACEKYFQALDIDSKDSTALNGWGVALQKAYEITGDLNKLKEACQKFEASIQAAPAYDLAYYNYAKALEIIANSSENKDERKYYFEETIDNYQKVLELDSNFKPPYNQILSIIKNEFKDKKRYNQFKQKYYNHVWGE